MKKIIYFLIFLLFLLIIITGSRYIKKTEYNNKEALTGIIGYCPTMERYAIYFEEKGFEIKKYNSSQEVISELKKNNIDIALIGRIAKKEELNQEGCFLECSKYTLISNKKEFIFYNDIFNREIHTYLKKETVSEILKGHENIIYHKDLDSATKDLSKTILIEWKDYKDEYELVIPLNILGEKIETFRVPILYTNQYFLKMINNECKNNC
jgi:hypothetical protein